MSFRVLCLHGMGVNATIFSHQTASLRCLLPSNYEFFYVDAPTHCDPAPGVAAFYPGPYRCWYNTPTTVQVARAHDFVFNVMQKEGPFDAVMGFSQGAALAASIILHHQLLHSHSSPSLFRAAIFICSPLPFSYSIDHGIDARAYFGSKSTAPIRVDRPTKVPEHLITDALYLRGEEELEPSNGKSLAEGSVAGKGNEVNYQMFHSSVDDIRIDIPTVHVFGRKDEWRLHSLDVVKLCREPLARVLEHDGGHEVPRSADEDICDAIETAVMAL